MNIEKLLETIKKYEKYLSYSLLKKGFIFLVSVAWAGAFLSSYDSARFRWGHAVHETGELAWTMLLFVIFVSLLSKILRLHLPKFTLINRALPLRKEAGIFAFLIVLTHALAEFLKRGILGNFSEIISTIISNDHAEIFGAVSFLIMLPLFLTSTNWAVKKMGFKSWKALQRFSHLAFVFAGLHVALVGFFAYGEIDFGAIAALLVYFGGYGYLFWRKSNPV